MPVPSPICTINGQTSPQDVAASSSVTIALANTTGAQFWFLTAIGTDEQNTAAAINATLSINQTNKTATFTAPSSLGSAVIFQSTVGISGLTQQGAGYDADEVLQADFTTTFKVNVTTSAGTRVLAVGETVEQDPVFGNIVEVNAAARGVLGAGTSASVIPVNQALTTTDASAHTIFTFAHPANANTDWSVTVVGRDTANNGHYYRGDIVFGYSRASGVSSGTPVSTSGSTTPTNVVNAQSWGGPAVSVSSDNIVITVQGAGSTTIDWSLIAQIQVVS